MDQQAEGQKCSSVVLIFKRKNQVSNSLTMVYVLQSSGISKMMQNTHSTLLHPLTSG